MTFKHKYKIKIRGAPSVKTALCVLVFLLAFSLTGCGKYSLPYLNKEGKITTEQAAPEIPYTNEKRPQSASGRKNLFSKSLRSDSERMERLERAVQDLRNDFDSVEPSVQRLVAVEGELKNLVRELSALNNGDVYEENPGYTAENEYAAPAPTVEKQKAPEQPSATKSEGKIPNKPIPPVAEKTDSYQKKPTPTVPSGKTAVYGLRVGEHPGKTRIVLDINKNTPYTVDIDNSEHIMVIDLPGAGWSAATAKSYAKSPLITSHKVDTSENGQILILQLKADAKLIYNKVLDGSTAESKRIVIDLAKG